MKVKLGATSRTQTNGFREIDSFQLIIHENYDPSIRGSEYNNDIGLIRLSETYKRG